MVPMKTRKDKKNCKHNYYYLKQIVQIDDSYYRYSNIDAHRYLFFSIIINLFQMQDKKNFYHFYLNKTKIKLHLQLKMKQKNYVSKNGCNCETFRVTSECCLTLMTRKSSVPQKFNFVTSIPSSLSFFLKFY